MRASARRIGLGLVVVVVGCWLSGCGGGPKTGTTDPEAKLRLERLLTAFNHYVQKNKKTPPSEEAFKAFLAKLPQEEKNQLLLGDDVDKWFVSPRDNEKYVIRYKMAVPDVGGDLKAIAWEKTGSEGKRWVALTNLYVEEKDEQELEGLKK